GKNILPYWMAAQTCGIEIVAVADNKLSGGRYRGIQIVSDAIARHLTFDAAIVSNSSPVHATVRRAQWRCMIQQPIIDLLEEPGSCAIAAGHPARQSVQTAAHIASQAA